MEGSNSPDVLALSCQSCSAQSGAEFAISVPEVYIALQSQVTPESKTCGPKIVAGKFWEMFDREEDN